jgi:hypothetical protein
MKPLLLAALAAALVRGESDNLDDPLHSQRALHTYGNGGSGSAGGSVSGLRRPTVAPSKILQRPVVPNNSPVPTKQPIASPSISPLVHTSTVKPATKTSVPTLSMATRAPATSKNVCQNVQTILQDCFATLTVAEANSCDS